jgi:hypothetical protein
MCPHTTTIDAGGAWGKATAGVVHVYICVLILPYVSSRVSSCYMCPHATTCVRIQLHVSSCYCMCPHTITCVLLMCPHTTICVLTCVLMLLHVSTCYYMCPHTTACVLMLLHVSSHNYMCPHATTCVLILLCVLRLLYMCPHNTLYFSPHSAIHLASAYYYICVLILQYMCPQEMEDVWAPLPADGSPHFSSLYTLHWYKSTNTD